MLSDSQLDDIKMKLENGRDLHDIVVNDYEGEKFVFVKRQLVEKFTIEVIQPMIVQSRMSLLSVEQLNKIIYETQTRLILLTNLRDSKL